MPGIRHVFSKYLWGKQVKEGEETKKEATVYPQTLWLSSYHTSTHTESSGNRRVNPLGD